MKMRRLLSLALALTLSLALAATAQAGMNAHIAKPIDMRQLAGVLQGLEGWH